MVNNSMACTPDDYVIRVVNSPGDVDAAAWNALLLEQTQPTPFMRHEYLDALHASTCAGPRTGWSARFFLLEHQGRLVGASVLYLKPHSRGEYVFDGSWAHAYARHGLDYYPKAVCAVPFTPVPGSRLLARNAPDRARLARALLDWCQQNGLSGLHTLFATDEDMAACQASGMRARHSVQFHWNNTQSGYTSFDDFLATLSQDKRKKIRQERRKVADAGVRFRVAQGAEIDAGDWDFFYRCYERTYLEHGNAPYLNREFFARMADHMAADWLLFIAERNASAIAASLIALNTHSLSGSGVHSARVAYGRYWGALERVDCLHFEACYYQPLQWCIANAYQRFEGGAQGEHKLARALLPVTTRSAHWLAHPDFFDAIDNFLAAERDGIQNYVAELQQHSPFRQQ